MKELKKVPKKRYQIRQVEDLEAEKDILDYRKELNKNVGVQVPTGGNNIQE